MAIPPDSNRHAKPPANRGLARALRRLLMAAVAIGSIGAMAVLWTSGIRREPLRPSDGVTAIALRHVAVIDVTEGRLQPDRTVVIRAQRIAHLGPADRVQVPSDVRVVDAAGKFLMPGLWDMHVHTSWDERFTLPLMVANGITGVREMFGKDLDRILTKRNEIATGALIGPDISTAGRIVDGPEAAWPGSQLVRSDAEAREAVSEQKRRGADFVKVYSSLTRETYLALADEATKQGLPFAGHVPDSVGALEASAAGQRSIEHLTGVLLACSDREEELRSLETRAQRRALVGTLSETKASAMLATFSANRTWQTPTLGVLRVGSDPAAPALDATRGLGLVPHSLSWMWRLGRRLYVSGLPAEDAEANRSIFVEQVRLVGAMQRAGVPILAGTDTPNPFIVPGFGLHDELSLLVEAGLSPLEALQSATWNPAVFLGLADSLGSVEQGKIANLVLLNANPLEDIANTRSISGVVVRGRLLEASDLDAILASVHRSRWYPNDASRILVGSILGQMKVPLLIAGAVLLALSIAVYRGARRWRRRRAGRTG